MVEKRKSSDNQIKTVDPIVATDSPVKNHRFLANQRYRNKKKNGLILRVLFRSFKNILLGVKQITKAIAHSCLIQFSTVGSLEADRNNVLTNGEVVIASNKFSLSVNVSQ